MEVNSVQARHEALLLEYQVKMQKLLDEATPKEREELGNPIKQVDKLDIFMANGRRYTIRTSLTIERFELFEELQQSVGYGIDFRNSFTNLSKAYGYLNEGKSADAAVVIYNQMNGVKEKLEDRLNEVLELCTLFICRDGEDLTKIDPAIMNDKVEDWKREGIDMDNFFHLAFNFVNGFTPIYNQVSQSISQHQEEVTKAVGRGPKTTLRNLFRSRRTR